MFVQSPGVSDWQILGSLNFLSPPYHMGTAEDSLGKLGFQSTQLESHCTVEITQQLSERLTTHIASAKFSESQFPRV